ncbi:hypothetical protein HK102_006902 [Quaeritorhiza haematococci]|nr:hypothetical protein HK102_006902 [Quaeritorhiza haematococci]
MDQSAERGMQRLEGMRAILSEDYVNTGRLEDIPILIDQLYDVCNDTNAWGVAYTALDGNTFGVIREDMALLRPSMFIMQYQSNALGFLEIPEDSGGKTVVDHRTKQKVPIANPVDRKFQLTYDMAYQSIVFNNQPTAGDELIIYATADLGEPGGLLISTYYIPVWRKGNEPLGTLRLDLANTYWGSLLENLKPGKTAKTFMALMDGTLIADSEGNINSRIVNYHPNATFDKMITTKNATENPDPLLAASAKHVLSQFRTFENAILSNETTLTMHFQGREYYCYISSVSGFNSVLVTVVESDEFKGPIHFSQRVQVIFTTLTAITVSLDVILSILSIAITVVAATLSAKRVKQKTQPRTQAATEKSPVTVMKSIGDVNTEAFSRLSEEARRESVKQTDVHQDLETQSESTNNLKKKEGDVL